MGGSRLRAVAERVGARVRVLPVKPGDVFARTGGLPLSKRSPERQAYRRAELRRWRDRLGIPLILEPRHFPADETLAAHATIAAAASGGGALSLSIAIGQALWESDADIADREVVTAAAESVGLDLDVLAADPAFSDAAATYDLNTEGAIAKGVFGVPTYIYRGEIFWGQDRLDFLASALCA